MEKPNKVPSEHREQRFQTLDGARGIAAICVMLFHFSANGLATATLFSNAFAAVDYFFCLSGFILSFTYDQRLRDGMTAGAFMTRRLVRLYPMYLLGLVLGLAAEFFVPSTSWGWRQILLAASMSLFFLPTLSPFSVRNGELTIGDYLFPLNAPAWSMFYELAVNWIYGIARPSTLAVFGIVVFSFGCLVPSLFYHGLPAGFSISTFAGGAPRALFFFFAGVLVFRLWRRFPPRLPVVFAAVCPILSLAVLVAICALPFGPRLYFVSVLLIPALIWVGTVTPVTGVERRVCSFLGEVSYPVYAIHAPVMIALQPAPGSAPIFSLPVVLALGSVVIVAAFIASRVWDIPARRRLSRLAEGLRSRLAALAPKLSPASSPRNS